VQKSHLGCGVFLGHLFFKVHMDPHTCMPPTQMWQWCGTCMVVKNTLGTYIPLFRNFQCSQMGTWGMWGTYEEAQWGEWGNVQTWERTVQNILSTWGMRTEQTKTYWAHGKVTYLSNLDKLTRPMFQTMVNWV